VFTFEFYQKHIRLLGVIAIVVCMGAWAVDWLEVVYPCPFCRVQRTIIGVLGAFMILGSSHFILKYFASVFAFFGAGVAMSQHFRGWVKIHKGEFAWYDPIYYDAFILSFLALFIIIAQAWIICLRRTQNA
jgi:disulfide bond formation protein DsbB